MPDSEINGTYPPDTDSIFGRLYRSSPEGLAALVKTVPAQTRAMLAIYCLRREQLGSIGLAIAETCERRDLLSQGGSAALDLIQKVKTSRSSPDGDSNRSAA